VYEMYSAGSRWVSVLGYSEHRNESFCNIKGGSFFDQLSEYKLLKKDSAVCS